MRNLVAVKNPPASAMSCADARSCLAALLEGPIPLTDWALAEAHLEQCAACREQQPRPRERAAARRLAAPRRAVRNSLATAVAGGRAGVTRAVALIGWSRALLTIAIGLPLRAIAGVMQAAGLGLRHVAVLGVWLCALTARTMVGAIEAIGSGIARSVAGIAHLCARLVIPCRSSVHAGARAIASLRRGVMRLARRLLELCSPRAVSFWPSGRAAAALVLVCALYALLPSERPPQDAAPVPPPRPELETRLEPVSLAPALLPSERPPHDAAPVPPPRPELETRLEPAPLVPLLPPPLPAEETGRARAQSSRAAALSPPRARAAEAALPAVPDDGPAVSTIHVIGRLSARERSAAERELGALLAGVGGAHLGRRDRVASTALDVVVPHPRYDAFARGLARIGSWRLEAERVPLPDAVHITIHVSE